MLVEPSIPSGKSSGNIIASVMSQILCAGKLPGHDTIKERYGFHTSILYQTRSKILKTTYTETSIK